MAKKTTTTNEVTPAMVESNNVNNGVETTPVENVLTEQVTESPANTEQQPASTTTITHTVTNSPIQANNGCVVTIDLTEDGKVDFISVVNKVGVLPSNKQIALALSNAQLALPDLLGTKVKNLWDLKEAITWNGNEPAYDSFNRDYCEARSGSYNEPKNPQTGEKSEGNRTSGKTSVAKLSLSELNETINKTFATAFTKALNESNDVIQRWNEANKVTQVLPAEHESTVNSLVQSVVDTVFQTSGVTLDDVSIATMKAAQAKKFLRAIQIAPIVIDTPVLLLAERAEPVNTSEAAQASA